MTKEFGLRNRTAANGMLTSSSVGLRRPASLCYTFQMVQKHELKMDLRGGRLVFSCSCGKWERKEEIGSRPERLTELHKRLQAEHAQHQAEAAAP
jgi:hypothetical protein